MNVTAASDRLKKVMRIALVGIKPGDQVMLKGYLRILLRLEADLEWVSANNQQIDLFMINHDFRNSESVQKLISNKPNTATIYTSRSESESGYVAQDLLVLPLKDLEPLSEWLFSQVPFLSGIAGVPNSQMQTTSAKSTFNMPEATTTATTSPTAQSTYQSSKPAVPTTTNNNIHTKLAEFNKAMSAPLATTQDLAKDTELDSLLDFAKLISRIQQRENEILTIKSPAGTLYAHVNPKQQRVWEVTEYISTNQSWVISLADETTKNQLDIKAAKNMVQWLWELSTKDDSNLEALLDSQIKYHIDSWVKPLHNAEQHDHLKIQCVLEARSVTMDELVKLSQCTLPQVKKTLIGLFAAGCFPASVYQQTITQLSTTNSQPAATVNSTVIETIALQSSVPNVANTAVPPVPSTTNEIQPISTAPQSKLDEILSRRAMANTGDKAPTNPDSTWQSSQNQVANKPVQSEPNSALSNDNTADGNNGMMGFLSRLRKRLGL